MINDFRFQFATDAMQLLLRLKNTCGLHQKFERQK